MAIETRTVFRLLGIQFCFVCLAAVVLMGKAHSQTEATRTADSVRRTLSDEIGKAAAAEIEHHLTAALSTSVRRTWCKDFERIVLLSEGTTYFAGDNGELLLAAFRSHVADHCRQATRRKRDPIAAADHLKTLRWKLVTAVGRKPLDENSIKTLKEQRAWIHEHVSGLPEIHSPQGVLLTSRKSTLAKLDSMLNDPLQPIFCEPFTETQFATLQTELNGYEQDGELVHVLPHLVRHATFVRMMPINRDWEAWPDKLVSAGHRGTLIRLGFGSSAAKLYGPSKLSTTSTEIQATEKAAR